MHVYNRVEDVPPFSGRSTVAFGVFDGVHLGHVKILSLAVNEARNRGVSSVVLTFGRHPRELIDVRAPDLLMTIDRRLEHLDVLGVDHCLLVDFDPSFARMDAETFARKFLAELFHAGTVVVGRHQRFGAGRRGDGALLRALGHPLGFETTIVEPVTVEGTLVSSSLIREQIADGDIALAARMLGRSYIIDAAVTRCEPVEGRLRVITDPHHDARPRCGRFAVDFICRAQHHHATAVMEPGGVFIEIELEEKDPSIEAGEKVRVELRRKLDDE